jgi:ATP-binding cassette subfamily B protein
MSHSDDTGQDVLDELDEDAVGDPNVRLFREYGLDHPSLLLVGLLTSVLTPLAGLMPPYVIGAGIDAVLREQSLSLLVLPARLIPETRSAQLLLVVALIAGFATLRAVLSVTASLALGLFAQRVQHDVRTDAYEKIQRLGVGFFEDKQTGEVMSILNNDVNELESLLSAIPTGILRVVAGIVGSTVVLLALNWQLALVALLPIPLLLFTSRYFVRAVKPKYESLRSTVGGLNAHIENGLSGIRVVKAYTAEDREAERVTRSSEEYLDANWDVITTRVKFGPSIHLISWLGVAVVFLVGGVWIATGPPLVFTEPLSVGTLVTFLIYSRQYPGPLRTAARQIDQYHEARASTARVFALMDYEVAVAEPEAPTPLGDVDGHVEFDDVTVTYPGAEEPSVTDVTFTAEPGEFVGLVGPTGSGKTTLMKLLVRFYDPDDGAITVDGVDLREAATEDLRGAIGYVSQEPFLFAGTVAENIAYGTPDADREAVERAATLAGADEFVRSLGDGYDTTVGQRGARLSGGQRQRIAIARAIVSDPEILILDEATAHVDNETEALVQNNLETVVADRTTFAIAHRISTVRDADRILVLDAGAVVERGTHEELLDEDGLYANLWRVQVGETESLPEEFIERTARRQADIEYGE